MTEGYYHYDSRKIRAVKGGDEIQDSSHCTGGSRTIRWRLCGRDCGSSISRTKSCTQICTTSQSNTIRRVVAYRKPGRFLAFSHPCIRRRPVLSSSAASRRQVVPDGGWKNRRSSTFWVSDISADDRVPAASCLRGRAAEIGCALS